MASKSWDLQVDREISVNLLRARLGSSRGRVGQVELELFASRAAAEGDDPGWRTSEFESSRGGTVRTAFVGQLIAEGNVLRLRVRYVGEPPFLVRVEMSQGDGPDGLDVLSSLWVNAATDSTESFGNKGGAGNIVLDGLVDDMAGPQSPDAVAREEFSWRKEAIAAYRAAQDFFLALDEETHFKIERPEWLGKMQRVQQELMDRIDSRIYFGNLIEGGRVEGATFYPLKERDFHRCEKDLGELSRVIVELSAKHLRPEPISFSWAFELFVSGRLSTPHPNADRDGTVRFHGAANSANFLQFPELAFLCIENGVDEDFWRDRVQHLVRAAHLFLLRPLPRFVGTPRGRDAWYWVTRYGYHPEMFISAEQLERVRRDHTDYLVNRANLDGQAELDGLRVLFGWMLGFKLKTSRRRGRAGSPRSVVGPVPDSSWVAGQ